MSMPEDAERALGELVAALAQLRCDGRDPAGRAALAAARSATARLALGLAGGGFAMRPQGMPDLAGHAVLVVLPDGSEAAVQALRGAGARVLRAASAEMALAWLELLPCDMALIDAALPAAARIVAAIRGQPGAPGRAPVLSLGAGPLPGADAALAGPDPALLAAALTQLQRNAAEALATAAGGDGPPVDAATYARLIALAGPEAEAAQELRQSLTDDLARVAQALRAALAEPSAEGVRAQTHVLIALAGAVGATRVQRLAEALNAAAHRGAVAEMAQLGGGTLDRLAELTRFIDAEQATAAASPRAPA